MPLILLHDCENCGTTEERIVTDSWTGKELCFGCAIKVLPHVTQSPYHERDNLEAELKARTDQYDPDDEDATVMHEV